jgi:hypothetical protein
MLYTQPNFWWYEMALRLHIHKMQSETKPLLPEGYNLLLTWTKGHEEKQQCIVGEWPHLIEHGVMVLLIPAQRTIQLKVNGL